MNIIPKSGERSGDEQKQPSTPPVSPIPTSPKGGSPYGNQQEEASSKLSDHTITSPTEDHEILEVERRVHDIARRLIEYLDIPGIRASSYPKVERVMNELKRSNYDRSTNVIGLRAECFNEGFTIGEEVAHWLHVQCLHMGPHARGEDPHLTYNQKANAFEFIGYIGRELARKACADSELQLLFDPQSRHAPMKVTDLREEHAAKEKNLFERYRWDKYFEKAKPLLDMSIHAAFIAILADRSSESLRYASLKEIIHTHTSQILAPIDQALRLVPSPPYQAEHAELWVKNLKEFRETLQSISFNLLASLAEGEKLAESAEEDVSERCRARRDNVMARWYDTLSFVHEWLDRKSRRKVINSRAIIFVQLDHATHHSGYEAAAVWLERTKDIRKSAAPLFYLSPEELHAKYVLPLNMPPISRGIYIVVQSARYLWNGLFGGAKDRE